MADLQTNYDLEDCNDMLDPKDRSASKQGFPLCYTCFQPLQLLEQTPRENNSSFLAFYGFGQLGEAWLWWFGFRLKQIFPTAQAS